MEVCKSVYKHLSKQWWWVANLHSGIHSLCLLPCAISALAWCYKFTLPLGITVYQIVFLIKVKRVNVYLREVTLYLKKWKDS